MRATRLTLKPLFLMKNARAKIQQRSRYEAKCKHCCRIQTDNHARA